MENDFSIFDIFNIVMKQTKKDIEDGFYTYGKDAEDMEPKYVFPRSFETRMWLKYGVNPYEEDERVPFSLL